MKITIEVDSIAELIEVSSMLAKIKAGYCEDVKQVHQLSISTRAHNCLLNEKITSIDDLRKMSDHDLLKIPNLGRKDLFEIRAALHALGTPP